MDWLTHLYLYGYVNMRLDVSNAQPAFPPPSDATVPTPRSIENVERWLDSE